LFPGNDPFFRLNTGQYLLWRRRLGYRGKRLVHRYGGRVRVMGPRVKLDHRAAVIVFGYLATAGKTVGKLLAVGFRHRAERHRNELALGGDLRVAGWPRNGPARLGGRDDILQRRALRRRLEFPYELALAGWRHLALGARPGGFRDFRLACPFNTGLATASGATCQPATNSPSYYPLGQAALRVVVLLGDKVLNECLTGLFNGFRAGASRPLPQRATARTGENADFRRLARSEPSQHGDFRSGHASVLVTRPSLLCILEGK
jgi:hypothetical protein